MPHTGIYYTTVRDVLLVGGEGREQGEGAGRGQRELAVRGQGEGGGQGIREERGGVTGWFTGLSLRVAAYVRSDTRQIRRTSQEG